MAERPFGRYEATLWLRITRKHSKERCLACPIAAYETDDLTGAHGERRAFDHEAATHFNAEVTSLEHGSSIGHFIAGGV